MGYFIRFRSFSYFFRKGWYCNRLKLILEYEGDNYKGYYKNYSMLFDIGAITIGRRKEPVMTTGQK